MGLPLDLVSKFLDLLDYPEVLDALDVLRVRFPELLAVNVNLLGEVTEKLRVFRDRQVGSSATLANSGDPRTPSALSCPPSSNVPRKNGGFNIRVLEVARLDPPKAMYPTTHWRRLPCQVDGCHRHFLVPAPDPKHQGKPASRCYHHLQCPSKRKLRLVRIDAALEEHGPPYPITTASTAVSVSI